MKYTIIFEPVPAVGYLAHVPALEGCVGQGETLEETMDRIGDAIIAWLEQAREEERPWPEETVETVVQAIGDILYGRARDGLDLIITTQVVEVS